MGQTILRVRPRPGSGRRSPTPWCPLQQHQAMASHDGRSRNVGRPVDRAWYAECTEPGGEARVTPPVSSVAAIFREHGAGVILRHTRKPGPTHARMRILSLTALTAIAALAAFRFGDAGPVRDVSTVPSLEDVDVARWMEPEPAPEPEWRRPDGPIRVALQAGHWKAAEAPDEQAGLRTNGTRGGGKAEWEVNLDIARRTARLLENAGYEVEVLPTTIPPGYWADLFVSIHADGHANTSVSGYRAAAPRRDRTGRAGEFAELLTRTYGEATGLRLYPTVTRRMTSYYAFNSRRYRHALDPMTVGVILETGFLTSAADRRIIVQQPDRAARGIADAIEAFLGPVPAATQRDPDAGTP